MTNPIQFVARNQIEDSFRKKRLITIPKEKPMRGPKANTKIVRDAIYNWLTPEVLYETHKRSTIDTVRRTIRAIVLQYLKLGIWGQVPKSMPYNTKGSAMAIEESFEFLSDLYQGDITKMFNSGTKSKIKARQSINNTFKESLEFIDNAEQSMDSETKMTVSVIPLEHKSSIYTEIKDLLKASTKYMLTREQIIESLKQLLKEEN